MIKHCRYLLLILFCLNWNSSTHLHGALAMGEERILKAGVSVVDITPATFPIDSAGSMGPRKALRTHDPLNVRCLVLDDGEMTIAMVTCDSCMIPREIYDNAKKIAAKKTGLLTSHMLCSATHTHTAVTVTPTFQSKVENAYCNLLTQKISEAIIEAYAERVPAKIGWAVGHNPRQVFNRRWYLREGSTLSDPFENGTDKVRMNPPPNHQSLLKPAGPVDPEVPIIAVQTRDGKPLALWANYSLHYVGGIPPNELSADYFGEFALQIQKKLAEEQAADSFVACMTNGTSGDINNINFFEGGLRKKPFEQVRLVAHDVATSAYNAYKRIKYYDWVSLGMVETKIELDVRKPSESEISLAKDLLNKEGPGPYKIRRHIYAAETLDLADYPATVELKLQTIRIGDLAIVTTPCETFVETGLELKKKSPFKPTFTIELANGYNGYLPPAEHHELGGYETWRAKSSYLAKDAEKQIRLRLLKMLGELHHAQK